MPAIWNNIQQSARNVHTVGSMIGSSLDKSYIGRSIKGAAAEMAGWNYSKFGTDKGKSTGFLGYKQVLSGFEKDIGIKKGSLGRLARKKGVMRAAELGAGRAGRAGISKLRMTKYGGQLAMGSLGMVFAAGAIYSGYQEGGLMGAVKSGGESLAIGAGMKAVAGMMGATLGVATGVAAVGYGAYRLGEAGKEYKRGLRQLEFGGTHMTDALGSAGAATSRQRAVMALQNTHLNGRMALGNEASVLHGIAAYQGR